MKRGKVYYHLTFLLAAMTSATEATIPSASAQSANGISSCPRVSTAQGSVTVVQERDASPNVSPPTVLTDGRYRIEIRLTPDPEIPRRVQLAILTSTEQGGEAYSISSIDRNEQAWQRITPFLPTAPSRIFPSGFTVGITEMTVGVLHNADGGVGVVVVSSPRANSVTNRLSPVAYPWDTFSVTRLRLDSTTLELSSQRCQERGEFAAYIEQPGAPWVRELIGFTEEVSSGTPLSLAVHYSLSESACQSDSLTCIPPQISAPRVLSPAAAVDPRVFFSFTDVRDELQTVRDRLTIGAQRKLVATIPRCARSMSRIDGDMRDSLLLNARWKQRERTVILKSFQRWQRTRSRLPTARQLREMLKQIEQLQQQATEDAKTLPSDGSIPIP